jgi:hypothetical protein
MSRPLALRVAPPRRSIPMDQNRPIIDYERNESQPIRIGDVIAILLLAAPFLLLAWFVLADLAQFL